MAIMQIALMAVLMQSFDDDYRKL